MKQSPYKPSLILKTMKENYMSVLCFFLPIVILLICSTKLLFSNLPVGVGEIVLAIFILSNCMVLWNLDFRRVPNFFSFNYILVGNLLYFICWSFFFFFTRTL